MPLNSRRIQDRGPMPKISMGIGEYFDIEPRNQIMVTRFEIFETKLDPTR